MQGTVIRQPSKIALLLTSMARVLFATLLFTAGGMGVGLLLGIVIMLIFGAATGHEVDMRHAYLRVAIPVAILAGTVALIGATVLEARARRPASRDHVR